MKNLLIAALLAFCQAVTAQTIKIDLPASVADKTFVTDQVKASEKRQKAYVDSLLKAKNDGGAQNPPNDLADCVRGPVPQEIYDVTTTKAMVLWDGYEVKGWDYSIYRGTERVAFGSVQPVGNREPVTYAGLTPGEYTLNLQGNTCKSKVYSKTFTIPKPTGTNGTSNPPPASGDVLPLVTLTEGFESNLNLQIRDSADVRIITDIAPDDRGANYLYRYLINGEKIDTDKRLKNYIVAGNNPLRVLVGKLKKDYKAEGFNKWGTGDMLQYGHYEPDGTFIYDGWFKMDAGEAFNYNVSYPFKTFVAPGPQAAGFLNHIPQNYDPSDQQVSWGDIAEDIKLPAGHFWGANWSPWGVEKVFAKGVTHLPHHSLPWNDADGNKEVIALKAAGKTHSNFQRIEAVFGRGNNGSAELWPNGTSKAVWPTAGGLLAEEARDWAWKTDASDALWLSEMSENVGWQPNDSPMFAAFYAELRKRYDQNFKAKGIPYEIGHNYFWLGGEKLNGGKGWDFYKNLFRLTPEQLPQTEFSPGGTLSSTTMIIEGGYLNAPDLVLRWPMELAWRLEYFKHMGYHAGVVLFGQGETRPNNRYKIRFPDGDYYKEDKFPLDPNVHIAAGFLSQVYGNLFVEWGGFGKTDQKLFDGRPGSVLSGDWFPTGSTVPQNNQFRYLWNGSGGIYYGFTGSNDLTYFSQRLYAKTFGKTNGGQRAYLKFRIDGGSWITPANAFADDIVNAYRDQRGFVLSESKDGKIAWFYLNSFADNRWHVLDVELPSGQVVSYKVAGNGIHAMLL